MIADSVTSNKWGLILEEIFSINISFLNTYTQTRTYTYRNINMYTYTLSFFHTLILSSLFLSLPLTRSLAHSLMTNMETYSNKMISVTITPLSNIIIKHLVWKCRKSQMVKPSIFHSFLKAKIIKMMTKIRKTNEKQEVKKKKKNYPYLPLAFV